ncbi:DUF6516 family protein [Caballeronia sp. LZ035]|uniref:toxin-antitoxin system TumE family protein n=1 Tax=Caballeronia sp. LZ035 TaxID=3038568 RepID=UPI0028647AB4|nr:DUF6516 family protein [Caballeronia sp. LZ035]MDR5759934.1 DUF6516 family protein [Caballeronia sp. LZ035]
MSNSKGKAILILGERHELSPDSLVEMKIWQVPVPVPGCSHSWKYRLAFVARHVCVLRYDNERRKGDHRHFTNTESPYEFLSLNRLLADFRMDMEILQRWRSRP